MPNASRISVSLAKSSRRVSAFKLLIAIYLAFTLCFPWSITLALANGTPAEEDGKVVLTASDSEKARTDAKQSELLCDAAAYESKEVLELREVRNTTSDAIETASINAGTPLSEGRLHQLASILPPFGKVPDEPKKFEIPTYTRKAPPTHKVIQLQFPPTTSGGPYTSADVTDQAAKLLTISEVTPQGSVESVSQVTIHFDQPMVPITTTSVSDEFVPVKLKPQPLGHWRWLDTSTLTFESKELKQFPRATTYEVEIPAGTKSQFGSRLENSFTSRFSTEPPRLISVHREPAVYDRLGDALRPVIVLAFNQPVDPESVLKHLHAKCGKVEFPLKLIQPNDVPSNDALKKLLAALSQPAYQCICIQPESDFFKNSTIRIIADPGIRSIEGPNTSEIRFENLIETYQPFALKMRKLESLSGEPFYISFSNDIESKSFAPDMVTITPRVENFKAELLRYVDEPRVQYSPSIKISGKTLAGRKYRVTLNSQLSDMYGQHLTGRKSVVNRVLTKKEIAEDKNVIKNLSAPQVLPPQNVFRAMLPNSAPSLQVWSLNLKAVRVSLYEAQPKDWEKFQQALRDLKDINNSREKCFSLFTLVTSKDVTTDAEPEIWKDTSVELSSLVKSGRTHIVAVVEALDPINPKAVSRLHRLERYTQWIEYSPVDLSVVNDQRNLYVMASDALTGKPLGGATATLLPSRAKSQTDANGLAKFRIFENQKVIEFRDGIVHTLFPRGFDRAEWNSAREDGQYLWYHKTDRAFYRPGDTVYAKGWVRWVDWERGNDRTKLPSGTKVNYVVSAPDDSGDISKGACDIDEDGSFSLNFKLPATVELGHCFIHFSLSAEDKNGRLRSRSSERFSIHEFRRPEFELSLRADKPYMVLGDTAALTAKTRYRSGGALRSGKVHWAVHSYNSFFCFLSNAPDLSGFVFGNGFSPRFPGGRIGDYRRYFDPKKLNMQIGQNTARAELEGTTDARGEDTAQLTCKSLAAPEPVTLCVQSTVQDLNRQNWSESQSVLVHPANIYVGLKTKQEFESTEEKSVKLIVPDLKSVLQADVPIDIDVVYAKPDANDRTKTIPELKLHKQLISDGSGPIDLSLDAKQSGTYCIVAVVHDKQGRLSKTILPFYVLTEEETTERNRSLAARTDATARPKFGITLDKKSYHVGYTAIAKVSGNVKDGHGFLYLQNNRILDVIPFSLANEEVQIPIVVKESFFPQCSISVRYFASNLLSEYKIDWPTVSVQVPMEELDLKVNVKAEKTTYRPGADAHLDISVRDGKGLVPNAQIALAVVDEAILALNGYVWNNPKQALGYWYHGSLEQLDSSVYRRPEPEPQPTWYQLDKQSSGLKGGSYASWNPSTMGIRVPGMPLALNSDEDANLFQVEPTVIQERHYTSGRSERHQTVSGLGTIKVRSDLNALAYFNPSIHTGSDGTAHVNFKLPDNLTKYRVMVVASAGAKEFGNGDTTFKTNMPLMLTPSLPRFLNYKDKCDLCFLAHNYTDEVANAEVVVRAKNVTLDKHAMNSSLEDFIDLAGRKVQIPPHGRVEVRIPATADHGSLAVVQAAAITESATDAAQLVIPLQPPVTTETFATSGYVDGNPISEQIEVPPALVPEVGGLSITTSSTAMQNLVDAGIYLRDYQFACSEQLSSQILGLASLDSLLSKFPDASQLKSSEIREIISRDVRELLSRQKQDGAFGNWSKESTSDCFVTAQCTQALWMASKGGCEVPSAKLEAAKHYLVEIKKHIPDAYRRAPNVALRAQALNVRFLMGDADPKEARKVLRAALAEKDSEESDPLKLLDIQEKLYRKMSLESMGWLWPVLASSDQTKADAASVRNVLFSHVSQTTENAEFQNNIYGEDRYWLYYSSNRLKAVLLESIIDAEPKNPMITKFVNELLQSRKNGCWLNTQENSRALMALSKYFDTFEKQVPDFVSQLWLGGDNDALYVEDKFSGRSTTAKEMKIPMEYLSAHPKFETLTLAKNGNGRLYYRLALKYAQKNLNVSPVSRGFEVTRNFEAVDRETDITRGASGIMHVKAGATLRVTLKVKAFGTRHHIALVDQLPAAFESVDSALKGNRSFVKMSKVSRPYFPEYWSEHVNMRDNRVEVFASTLNPGEHDYVYFVNATQLGSFIVPPCKVEEMYNPETFGRTGTEFVVVE